MFRPIKCAKCENDFGVLQIRKCPYSEKGLYICVYCCKKCPYVKEVQLGWTCTYGRR